MITQFKIDEGKVQAAWLKTLYDLVDELNCKATTTLVETYTRSFKYFARTRIVKIYGSETMVSWLKLRMERYDHLVSALNDLTENQNNLAALCNTEVVAD